MRLKKIGSAFAVLGSLALCLLVSSAAFSGQNSPLSYFTGEVAKVFGPEVKLILKNPTSQTEPSFKRALSNFLNPVLQYAKSKKGEKFKAQVSNIIFVDDPKASKYGEFQRNGSDLLFVADMAHFGVSNVDGPRVAPSLDKLYPEVAAADLARKITDDLIRISKNLKEQTKLDLKYEWNEKEIIAATTPEGLHLFHEQIEYSSAAILSCAGYQNCLKSITGRKISRVSYDMGNSNEMVIQRDTIRIAVSVSSLRESDLSANWNDKFKRLLKLHELRN